MNLTILNLVSSQIFNILLCYIIQRHQINLKNLFTVANPCERSNGGCNHMCEAVGVQPKCSCFEGYVLSSDNKTCVGQSTVCDKIK